MTKIEHLTPEQSARLVPWREEWLRRGTCTEPCDRAPIEAAVKEMYSRIGKGEPRIIWTAGPATSALLVHVLRGKASLGASLDASLRDSLGDSLWASLGDSLWASLGASLWASLGASLWASLRDSLGDSLRDSLGDSLWASLGDSLWASLRDSLWASLRASLRASLQFYGQHESYWVAYYLFAADVLGVQFDRDADLRLWQVLCGAGWWGAFEGVAIIADRPEIQRIDARGAIHCEDGPAIKCRDGWEVYAIDGVRVSPKTVLAPAELTVAEIKAEKNAEARRVMRERFGEGRYLAETGAKLIHADYETARKGAAPRALMQDDENQRFLVGTDGSTGRVYYMRVPNDVTTCREAHVALCGFDETKILNKS